jgi:hypothetical protein
VKLNKEIRMTFNQMTKNGIKGDSKAKPSLDIPSNQIINQEKAELEKLDMGEQDQVRETDRIWVA